MAPQVDPAILEALHLDSASTTIASHSGGSGFASTFKLSSTDEDGNEKLYFVKTASGRDAEVMFQGEHASLNAIHDTLPNFCPQSYAHGPMKNQSSFFLATDFLDLGGSGAEGSGLSFAAKLAKLHSTPAPIPDGYGRPMFGFPVTTCCGDTPQDNSWKESWADFYADNRLRGIMKSAKENHGSDPELEDTIEKVASKVVPRLIGDETVKGITPVLIHGDLWSGNHSRGRISGQEGAEEVVYDASAVYGHSEYELGIMRMFGGFGGTFWKEYEKVISKAEPKEEWEDRIMLYELYHHLNHFSMFGGSYRGGAMSIMKKLICKYGS